VTQLYAIDVVEDDLRVEAFRMLAHAIHERRSLQAFDITGPVVDVRRRHELAALFEARNHHGRSIGPRGIDRRRVARGARA
jgi:hypothetical protein